MYISIIDLSLWRITWLRKFRKQYIAVLVKVIKLLYLLPRVKFNNVTVLITIIKLELNFLKIVYFFWTIYYIHISNLFIFYDFMQSVKLPVVFIFLRNF